MEEVPNEMAREDELLASPSVSNSVDSMSDELRDEIKHIKRRLRNVQE